MTAIQASQVVVEAAYAPDVAAQVSQEVLEVAYSPVIAIQVDQVAVEVLCKNDPLIITASKGTFTLTGISAGLKCTRKIAPAKGTFTLTGKPLIFIHSNHISADKGTFTLTGRAAALKYGRKTSASKGTFTLTGIATITHARVSQVSVEVVTQQNTSTIQTSQVIIEAGYSTFPVLQVSQIVLEVLHPNAPLILYALSGSGSRYTVTGNAVNFVQPFPAGLSPLVENYTFKLPASVNRVETQAGNRYSLIYSKGKQTHSLLFRMSLAKLEEFNTFYFSRIKKGALDFSVPMDSGNGLSSHNVTMLPETLEIQHYGNYADVAFQVSTPSQLLSMTQNEADTFLSSWNNDATLVDHTGGFIFTSRFPYMAPSSSMVRFDARYWIVDFRIGSVATIVGNTATAFTVNAEFRSNLDLVGIIWNSVDRYGHPVLRYDTDRDHTGTIYAFVANPLNPWDFSLTITVGQTPYVYRLFPFYNNSGTLTAYYTSALTQGTGPGHTYSAATLFPGGLTIPSGYHVFILDFSTLKLGFAYDGASVPVTSIDSMFISFVPNEYGIGVNAVLADAVAANLTSWHITGVPTDFRIQAGDIITVSYTQGATFYQVPVTVTTWTGDGTTERFLTMATPMTGVTWTGSKVIAQRLTLDSAIGNVTLALTVQNMSVTGSRTTIGKYEEVQLVNGLKIATGFDDSYNINPWRQVDQIYKLGYRGDVICYMGASHFYKASSYLSGGVYFNRIITTDSNPINPPTVAWCQAFFAELASKGLGFVWSTSLEILLSQIPPDWAQKDVDDNLAASGYTPPTSFLNFIMPEVQEYLTNVIKQGLALLTTAGITLKVQLGEWWSWDGSYSNGKPCIYAFATKTKYHTDTGLYAPTTITNIFQQPLTSGEQLYCEYMGQQLGIATANVRDALKTAYPAVKVCLLFFSPQIFNQQSVILPIINFPSTYWKYPNYDFMQIEDYDWVIDGAYNLLPFTIYAAQSLLNYPLNLVDYFIGFVNTQADQFVWGNMHVAVDQARKAGITSVVVWAYPQIVRDGITDDYRFPRGLVPEVSPGSVTIHSTDGVFRSNINGSVLKNISVWARGNRQIEIVMSMTSAELKAFLVFLYFNVNLGAITFSLPIDDGAGFKLNRVNIIPGSIEVSSAGYLFWTVKMDVEGEPGYFGYGSSDNINPLAKYPISST